MYSLDQHGLQQVADVHTVGDASHRPEQDTTFQGTTDQCFQQGCMMLCGGKEETIKNLFLHRHTFKCMLDIQET